MSTVVIRYEANDGSQRMEVVSEHLADLLFSRDLARPGAIRTETLASKEE